ncbi:antigen B membrane [Brachionus plicatilis]|uniref:Antigen B membrane n=1 Tax=Brachionus plicatilis TaxID=10195 RepID=A0A3M7P7Y9_BRAPC|nr:antigen B membrane [Brachionus plicatilis]
MFNFDPVEPSFKTFDVSQCYKNKEKIQFAISFDYPQDIDKIVFKEIFERYVEKKFYEPILSALSVYNLSPLRIIPSEIRASNSGFVIYTGLTSYAPPINHFRRLIDVKIDIQQVVNRIESSSPENCAYQCLKDSALNTNFYRCLSFDLCLNTDSVSSSATFICSFYNSSFSTDPSLIIENGTLCDHYSKNVITFDSVDKEDAFRIVEDAVLKGLFNIDYENSGLFLSFKANDIYPATLDASTDSTGKPPQGSTSFFQKFRLANESFDLNLEIIKQNNSIQFRQRKGISIDECARLCIKELAFRCDALTYESILRECKWSSITIDFLSDIDDNKYVIKKDGFFIYQRDVISLFTEFPFTTATRGDLIEIIVKNEEECAYECSQEKKFKCRSFNLCDNPRDEKFKYRCLLSDKHTHDDDKNPDLIYSPTCRHFSRENIDDYKLVAGYQLNVKPEAKYVNTSVDRCASVCSYMEAFVCRSFDYLIDTNVCWLYKENVKDNIHSNVELFSNKNSNHYSREYLIENGISLEIDAVSKNRKKYQTGTLVSVSILSLIIGSALGMLVVWFAMKIIRKRKDLPAMNNHEFILF